MIFNFYLVNRNQYRTAGIKPGIKELLLWFQIMSLRIDSRGRLATTHILSPAILRIKRKAQPQSDKKSM